MIDRDDSDALECVEIQVSYADDEFVPPGYPFLVRFINAGGPGDTFRVASVSGIRELIRDMNPQTLSIHGNSADERNALEALIQHRAH